jgi:CBS domain-containing protein
VIGPDADVLEAARLMREFHVGTVVVVNVENERRFPIGIVTDRDLVVEILGQDVVPEAVSVRDIMSNALVTAAENDSLWDTISQMRSKSVRRVLVLGQAGELVGLLAVDDVLELLAEELSQLVKITVNERKKEKLSRP